MSSRARKTAWAEGYHQKRAELGENDRWPVSGAAYGPNPCVGGQLWKICQRYFHDSGQAPTAEEIARTTKACDRRTATGRRAYSIHLRLARLGLRAGEVVALQFEDINWRAGEILRPSWLASSFTCGYASTSSFLGQ